MEDIPVQAAKGLIIFYFREKLFVRFDMTFLSFNCFLLIALKKFFRL